MINANRSPVHSDRNHWVARVSQVLVDYIALRTMFLMLLHLLRWQTLMEGFVVSLAART